MPENEREFRIPEIRGAINFAARERMGAERMAAEILGGQRPRRRTAPLDIETIGVEFEGLHISQDGLYSYLMNSPMSSLIKPMFTLTRDASAEMRVFTIRNGSNFLQVNADSALGKQFSNNFQLSTVGFELVSKPLLTNDQILLVQEVIKGINASGGFVSERCATHVHIGISNSLNVAKSSLAFALYFEDLFYALAGMGGEFRGHSNNSAYARPLSRGIFVPVSGRRNCWARIPNVDKAMGANDMYEFYHAFMVDLGGDLIKHHPCRYTSINMYSIIEKGTLEFRVANATLNAAYITSYIKLCQACAELVSSVKFQTLATLGICDVNFMSKAFYKEKLRHLNSMINIHNSTYFLSEEDLEILDTIIEESPPFSVGESENVLTHLRDFQVSEDMVDMGELQITNKRPNKPGNVDIHNIKENDNSIL